MVLTIPDFIEGAGIIKAPIKHLWNDEISGRLYAGNERLENKIDEICDRGIVALSAGFAEWVFWRMSNFSSDPTLLQYIEAVWAGILDWQYMSSLDTTGKKPHLQEWQGPERGPICRAFLLLAQIVDHSQRSSFSSPQSTYLSQVALHVIPNQKQYKDWRRFVIKRLSEVYPVDEEDELGPPIPREVLEPDFDYKPDMANELISKYLQSLDYEENPFLRSPEEMKRAGFEGTPYTF